MASRAARRVRACAVLAVGVFAMCPGAGAKAAGAASGSVGGTHGARVPVGKLPLPATCQDVLVLGARGSGQPMNGTDDGNTGMGPEVYQAYSAIVDELPPGTRVAAYGIPYEALPFDLKNFDHVILGRFFKGVEGGVRMVQNTLRGRAGKCDQELVVLAGFSQGRAVMHRVLQRAIPNGMRDRIAGALLIADADRRPSAAPTDYGSAPNRTQGLATWVSRFGIASKGTKAAVCGPDRVSCASVHSVCTDDDPICDFVDPSNPSDATFKSYVVTAGIWLKDHVHVHEGYRERSDMFDAAAALGAQVAGQLTGEDARYEACLDESQDRFDFEDGLYAYCNDVVYGTTA